ncbi:transcription termination/antitermination factor NusG [Leptospira ryugenii]|uniref:Transcription termination/antitermination factor NusG n=1 Tax=Leptospira ryugenii TaxID=1917863 RepID=A0A2P2E3D6_9LEPT|nr:UpxY family transcription antiterminator [Leptospira ryugenii]GBF51398.1 transcription termination/antitermination factor NusG [Leptospira ryugenii]
MQETDSPIPDKNWYIVYTNPRAEKKLSGLLNKYKVENYLPLITERKKWSDRIKVISTPCFKSYLFVRISFWEERIKVLQLPGSNHFVYAKGEPAILPDTTVSDLKALLENRDESSKVRVEEALIKGKKVKIILGPFAGREAEIVERRNKVGILVRINEISKTAVLEVNMDQITWEDLSL